MAAVLRRARGLARHARRASVVELSPPRDHWYIAARAREVGRTPVARTVLGERLALFRDAEGRPAALADRCLHRNMALSAAPVGEGGAGRPDHPWRYSGPGTRASGQRLGPGRLVLLA